MIFPETFAGNYAINRMLPYFLPVLDEEINFTRHSRR